MGKVIYTQTDIDELKARGITSLDWDDSIVLTDLALERAQKIGLRVNRLAPSAPPRATYSPSVNLVAGASEKPDKPGKPAPNLRDTIKAEVLARLDKQVDMTLLDAVITRVLAGRQ